MSMPARRLFDANGYEIFRSKDIQRGAEYYVSSGENFKSSESRAEVSYQLVRNETESIRMESDVTNLVQREYNQKASSHTGRSETVLVDSSTYV
jgi:hypothetical protein